MAIPYSVRRGIVAVLLLIAFVLQGTTSVLAGTTGAINGSVVDPQSNQAITGARVTAASPSQSATTTTDATGRFSFISLAPDTYTVLVTATSTRDAASVSGVTVQADQTLTVSLQQPTKLKVIGTVTSRAASALVKPGTTADVYSINAVTQDKASTIGGGGNLNTAWSAIAAVPGVFIAPNQTGYIGAGPAISIRGGDYDQIGYELDGVPVNRAFDNYPSGPLSSLGQQELQVYTGASPANSEAEGLSGYINQVIRTGTAPASRNLDLAMGTPIMYNKISFEAGGANPSRTFSYYLGAGAYNQNLRYYDQYNGASLQQNWGYPIQSCYGILPGGVPLPYAAAPSCYANPSTPYSNVGPNGPTVMGPFQTGSQAQTQERDSVLNLHFGIPRKDGNRDDVQALVDINHIGNPLYLSANDLGGNAYLNSIGYSTPLGFTDGYQFTGQPVGSVLPIGYTGGGVQRYNFPQSPFGRAIGGAIAPDYRDAFTNDQGIFKLQYQRNFGTNAFLRVYGYTYYSSWLQAAPVGVATVAQGYLEILPGDYELESHTRGVSAQFSDQLNSQHLLSIQGSYTMATTLRDNNTQYSNGSLTTGVLVNGSNPLAGQCYTIAGAAVPCFTPTGGTGAYARFSISQAYNGTVPVVAPGTTCGSGPCQWLLAENGQRATYNSVQPKFASFSITDQWKPTDRLNINLGLRYDQFQFIGSDTTGSPARTFWYNAWNAGVTPNLAMTNPAHQSDTFGELQPRLGMTYTLSPTTVLRASWGRYAQAPNSAFEQYNFLQQDAPPSLVNFVKFGIGTTPMHQIRPEVSNNYDFSLEHQFGRDTSVKFTPFLRKTQDQIEQFYLDQRTNFVSGLNVGAQTSQGFEFELDKGDFSRNGLAARLTFAYTDSKIRYTREPNGGSVVDGLNTQIAAFNSLTKSGGGAPCYTAGGAPDGACAVGSIANPYYNYSATKLLDPNGQYPTFDTFPAGVDTGGYSTFGAPYVATLLLQYKHGPLAITPAIQFNAGARYGVPLSNFGFDPSAGCGALSGSTTGDPRYPYGAVGGAPADAGSCGGILAIPNTYTNNFDGVGAFVQPNQLLLHTQVSYDVNKRVTLVGSFANIVNRCWGGTKVPWAVNHACSYGIGYDGVPSVGNVYNPGTVIQPYQRAPYDPYFAVSPFSMYFEARIKL